MRLPLFFAFRYLFSKKSVNAINIISGISMIGVLISSAALIIILSLYNGIENFILSQYSSFSSDLRIEPTAGKLFDPKNSKLLEIQNNEKVQSYTEVLEDKILVEYHNKQFIGKIKGISDDELKMNKDEDLLVVGSNIIMEDSVPKAIIGAQVQASLGITLNFYFNDLHLYIPNKKINSAASNNPLDEINHRSIEPNGVLNFQPGFGEIIITPISFAKNLLNESDKISAVEIILNQPDENINSIKKEFQQILGENFLVKNREQQNPTLYKTTRSEKWMVFFITTMIGIIAIFNIIGSLTMLVIDKKQDMQVLKSLGANNSLIERIFFYEGVLISFIGSLVGIVLGLTFCFLQDRYGFVKTGGQTLFESYPVEVRKFDCILIFITVLSVSIIISFLASKTSTKSLRQQILQTSE